MARGRKSDLLTAIDIGTEWVRCVIAERTEAGIDIIGVGKARSTGLKRGVVINIDSTVTAIRSAVEAAELMSGREVSEAYCSITGSHVASRNQAGMVSVKNNEVKPDDVQRCLQQARTCKLEEGRGYVHVLPIEFSVDDNPGLQSPLGIAGVRLETRVHMITAARAAMDNIITCCNREGIRVAGLVFSPLAASEVILHEDEKELGVILADIGAGTTDFVVWHNGSVIQSGVVNIGGKQISDELAVALHTPRAEAEAIKLKHAVAMASEPGDDEVIRVPMVGARKQDLEIKRALLGEVIEPTLEEIFTTIGTRIREAGNQEFVSAGIVLTGGTSLIPGVENLAHQILGVNARVGDVINLDSTVGGVTSAVTDVSFSVALGMVLNVARERPSEKVSTSRNGVSERGGDGLWGKLRRWLEDAFVSH
jgi:cell division protein FtsA